MIQRFLLFFVIVVSPFLETTVADDRRVYITIREIECPSGFGNPLAEQLTPVQQLPTVEDSSGTTDTRIVTLSELKSELTRLPSANPHLRPPSTAVSPYPDGIAVLSDAKFEMMIRALAQTKGVDLLTAPSAVTEPGVPVLIKAGPIRRGILPRVKGETGLIELDLYLPGDGHSMGLHDGKFRPSVRIKVPNNYAVICSYEIDGATRYTTVRAKIMDPAGVPIVTEGDIDRDIHLAHAVQSGESVAAIADFYDISVEDLCGYNDLSEGAAKLPKSLRIPLAVAKMDDFPLPVLESEKKKGPLAPIFKALKWE